MEYKEPLCLFDVRGKPCLAHVTHIIILASGRKGSRCCAVCADSLAQWYKTRGISVTVARYRPQDDRATTLRPFR